MSLTSLYTGISGLNASGTALSVIGDNIANMNTVGFKSSRVSFGDVLSSTLTSGTSNSQVGRGVLLSGVNSVFTQGAFETTGNALDMAIDGDGFFIVSGDTGTYYSRAGEFRLDKDGNVVTLDGLKLQGYQYTSAGEPTGVVGDINVSALSSSTQSTENFTVSANVDSRGSVRDLGITGGSVAYAGAPIGCAYTVPLGGSNAVNVNIYDSTGTLVRTDAIGDQVAGAQSYTWDGLDNNGAAVANGNYTYEAVGGFDVNDPSNTSNFSSAITVFDSLGNKHVISTYFTKLSANTWTYNAYVGAGDSISGTPQVASGLMTFDSSGALTSSDNVTVTFDFAGGGEQDQDLTMNFENFTQYASSSETLFQSQDGFPAGSLQTVSVSQDGVISGIFSNGQIKPLARLSLAKFTAPTELTKFGRNLYGESFDSGQAIVGSATQAGLGRVMSNSLELSNVDLAKEFVSMISAQRGFQANSRVISVTDGLLQELVNLTR